MKRTTEDAYNAFINKRRYSGSNTKVRIEEGESYMYLFGNLIAKTEGDNILINHCGYCTNTTRERLNAFNVNIRKQGSKFIVNEQFVWESGWLNLNHLN